MRVHDSNGRLVTLARKIGSGGEGAVFEVAQEPLLVAKLYHGAPSTERQAKIEAMVRMADEELLKFTAWPKQTLYSEQRRFVGFLMPRVIDHKDIHLLYSPKSRRHNFPDKDWRFLFSVARNVATAFALVHRQRCIIGDVNHGNVVVSNDSTVKLIDCDSIQVTVNRTTYPCEVGVPLFTAPELQNLELRGVVRTENHDAFGLAVLLFHLLFLGRHPFAGRFHGPGEMPIERAIAERRFAYSSSRSQLLMDPPPNAVLLDDVPPTIAALFERAFVGGNSAAPRPTASEWVQCLESLSSNVARCPQNEAHFFFRSARKCPWCAIESAIGRSLFPVRNASRSHSPRTSIAQLWTAIEAVVAPPPLQDLGFAVTGAAPQSNAVRSASQAAAMCRGFGIAVLVAGIASALIVQVCWLALGGAVGCAMLSGAGGTALEQARSKHAVAETAYRSACAKWLASGTDERFSQERAGLRIAFDELAGIDQLRESRLAELRKKSFLDDFFIRGAKVPGIGPSRVATLASHNIETAWDITSDAVKRIPGFGPSLADSLVTWRHEIERKFDAARHHTADPADVARLDAELAARRQQLESRLLDGPKKLEAIKVAVTSERAELQRLVKQTREACIRA